MTAANITAREPDGTRAFFPGFTPAQARAKGLALWNPSCFPRRARLASFQKRTVQTCARPGKLPCEISFHRRFTALWGWPLIRAHFPHAGGHPAAPFRSRFQKFPSEPDESRLSVVMRMPCRQPAAPAARIWFGEKCFGLFSGHFPLRSPLHRISVPALSGPLHQGAFVVPSEDYSHEPP